MTSREKRRLATTARAARKKANEYPRPNSYNGAYLTGYADAYAEIAGLMYCAVSKDGKAEWKWLTEQEILTLHAEGYGIYK